MTILINESLKHDSNDSLSVRAAGIPRALALAITETVPLSSVLPVMAIAILCVLATYCSVTQVHESAPEASPVHKSAPEVSPVHESAPEASPVHESAPEASPVHQSAPEASPVHESAPEASPVHCRTMEAIHKLAVCLVTAMEAIHELTDCSVTAKEAILSASLSQSSGLSMSLLHPAFLLCWHRHGSSFLFRKGCLCMVTSINRENKARILWHVWMLRMVCRLFLHNSCLEFTWEPHYS